MFPPFAVEAEGQIIDWGSATTGGEQLLGRGDVVLGGITATNVDFVYKVPPLVHHIRFHPRYPPGVNDVPGLVLTMCPDRTDAFTNIQVGEQPGHLFAPEESKVVELKDPSGLIWKAPK